MCKFDKFASYCLTEPDSGSDNSGLSTAAVDNGEGQFVLNGTKSFISNASLSDVYIVICKTDSQ